MNATTKNDDERIAMLAKLNLPTDGDSLAGQPAMMTAPQRPSASADVRLAPPGIDPRMQPTDEIHFDPALLDRFPSLEGDGLRAASDYVFSLYKSYGRNTDRNGALHRKITTFITQTRRSRQTGGMVKEAVKSTKEQRDIAAVVATQEATASDVADAFRAKQIIEALKAQGVDVMALMTE